MIRACSRRPFRARRGATLVEAAVILPVFFLFMASLAEFGHAYMVINTLKAATNKAARKGVADDITTAQVVAQVEKTLSAAFKTANVSVYVKNGDVFDSPGVDPEGINYSGLPEIELSDAEPRQLFIVRAEVPYDSVAIFPPFWIKDITLTAQTVMRHE